MKYILVLLVLLILVGCAPADTITTARQQYQVASANLSAAIAQQAAYDKATVQARQAEQIAALSTQGAQDAQIRDLEIQASATMQAIDARAQQADLENKAALATRIANDYNLQATQVWGSARATATVVALDVASREARLQRQQATADFWSGFLPNLAMILTTALVFIILIFLLYYWRRTNVDIRRREQEQDKQEYFDRYYPARNGTYYLPPGEHLPILINQLDRIWALPSGAEQLNHGEELVDIPEGDEAKPVINISNDPRFLAQKLLAASAQAYGWESHDLFGYRQAGMGGRQWTEAVELIAAVCDNHIERRQGEGTRLLRENLQQAYYKVNQSPSPTIDVE